MKNPDGLSVFESVNLAFSSRSRAKVLKPNHGDTESQRFHFSCSQCLRDSVVQEGINHRIRYLCKASTKFDVRLQAVKYSRATWPWLFRAGDRGRYAWIIIHFEHELFSVTLINLTSVRDKNWGMILDAEERRPLHCAN